MEENVISLPLDLDISTIMANTSDRDFKEPKLSDKISFINQKNLQDSGFKRANSKIQWIETPMKGNERKFFKSSVPVLGILTSRGYRWNYIHDAMVKLRWEEVKQPIQTEAEIHGTYKKAYNHLIQDLGSGSLQLRHNKNAELTLDQQAKLEVLKHKVKNENDFYLRRHPEVKIGIMIKLIFAKLFKMQPHSPNEFVSDYVHHLNKHREELMVKDVNIPFDQPAAPEPAEDLSSEDEERQQIRQFARQIVESCIHLATLGESYIDVMFIINSLLESVTQSESNTSIVSAISNAETAVADILMALLNSVPSTDDPTIAELVVEELLDAILSNLSCARKGSKLYLEMKNSVEIFVKNLLDNLIESSMNQSDLLHIMAEPKRTLGSALTDETGRSILRTDMLALIHLDEELKNKTKVKFQSVRND